MIGSVIAILRSWVKSKCCIFVEHLPRKLVLVWSIPYILSPISHTPLETSQRGGDPLGIAQLLWSGLLECHFLYLAKHTHWRQDKAGLSQCPAQLQRETETHYIGRLCNIPLVLLMRDCYSGLGDQRALMWSAVSRKSSPWRSLPSLSASENCFLNSIVDLLLMHFKVDTTLL